MVKSTGNSVIFYEFNGCKFKHEAAGMCKLLMDCTTYLCQFTHKKDASENVDKASVDKVRIEPSIKSSKEEKMINPEQEKHAGNKFKNDDDNALLDSNKTLEIALQKINTLEENKRFLQNKLTQYGTQLRIFINGKEGKQTS